ncbi:conserved hypothetical protein [Shewanella violacea DSS12]|uniref:Dienelactone hydrolase domain-containing protein n=2 Tax=Shewanella violacea TaxID=60217 RepID=D4ZCG3_SHEVD|nr:conserved hypothetical protein [Shewanella violacea DSS12]
MHHEFETEQSAYQMFMAQLGHLQYAQCVAAAIQDCDEEIILIGFSAGASAIFKALSDIKQVNFNLGKIKHFIGFYPSQIRHYLALSPACTTSLIFPDAEVHFDVSAVILALAEHREVTCIRTNLNHGFMNSLSEHFAPQMSPAIFALLGQSKLISDASQFRHRLSQLGC